MEIDRGFVFAGFGKDERNRDGNIQQTNVTLLSNEECYEKLNNIMKTNVQGYTNRIKIQQAVYDGITDQLICTNGLVVEKCRKGRCRKFFSVSRPFPKVRGRVIIIWTGLNIKIGIAQKVYVLLPK